MLKMMRVLVPLLTIGNMCTDVFMDISESKSEDDIAPPTPPMLL